MWLQRGRVLVWGAGPARALGELRVGGALLGAPPRRGGAGPRGGRGRRLPLELLPEGGRLLAELGVATVGAPPSPPDPPPDPPSDLDPPPGSDPPPEMELGAPEEEKEKEEGAPPPRLLVALPTARPGPPPSPLPPPQGWGRPSPHWPQGGRPPHERRFRVYRELWGRGLHLTGGGKFGGDFLVYPGPPELFHAAAVALCPPPGAPLPLGVLVGGARLGTQVRKSLVLCAAPPGGAPPAFTSLQWRGDLG